MVTCDDIAKEAGVNKSTVSRVLNGSKRISKTTTEKVLKAIERLHYIPNEHARFLSNQVGQNVGMVIPDLSNPFYGKVANQLSGILKKDKVSFITNFVNGEIGEFDCLSSLLSLQTDLILFTPLSADEKVAPLLSVPGRKFLQLFTPAYSQISSIRIDDAFGTYQATKRLLSAGHRRILCLDTKAIIPTTRKEGFEQAFVEAGEPFDPSLYLEIEDSPATYLENTSLFIEKQLTRFHPTAVIVVGEYKTNALFLAMRRMKLEIGRDLSLIAYDDCSLARLFGVDVITPDFEEIAKCIARETEQMLSRDDQEIFNLKIQPLLVKRNSVWERLP